MNSPNNCFENLIDSFKKVCFTLERNAELTLKQVESECEEEFAQNVKSLQKFNKIVSGISETCVEVISNSDTLKCSEKKIIGENTIYLPFEKHADVVKCINELYNMPSLENNAFKEKLMNERSKNLITDLLRIGKKNIYDVKDTENVLIEAKEIF